MTLVSAPAASTSSGLSLPNLVAIEDRTDSDCMIDYRSMERGFPFLSPVHLLPPNLTLSHTLYACHGEFGTGYRLVFIIDGTVCPRVRWSDDSVIVLKSLPIRSISPSPRPLIARPAVRPPAEELREISGLPPTQLAQLFGVSRTTYYNWMEGVVPREDKFDHLVEVLSHIKDAQKRLAETVSFGTWLRSPISAGGPSPLDTLRDRRFSLFRGLVVRALSTAERVSTVKPSIVASSLNRLEKRVALGRIGPQLLVPDEDDE